MVSASTGVCSVHSRITVLYTLIISVRLPIVLLDLLLVVYSLGYRKLRSIPGPSISFLGGIRDEYAVAMSLQGSIFTSRKELAFRSAILYGGLLISNAFGSVGSHGSYDMLELLTRITQLMAAGILSRMDGKRGIRAWRW